MMNRQMMTCAEVDEALSEYLEATLDVASRGRVDEHIAGCLRCSAILRDIGVIRAEAGDLSELAPSRDLWAGIAVRIEPTVLPMGVPSRRELSRRWIPVAAAAAAALVIATSGITYLATARSFAPSEARVAVAPAPAAAAARTAPEVVGAGTAASVTAEPVETVGLPASAGSTAAPPKSDPVIRGRSRSATLASRRSGTPASPGEIAYGDEIERLQNIITVRRRELDPATVTVIEQSLKIIDAAVKQSRAALARDPRSGFLADQLNHALDKKIELLRTVALLPSRT